MTDTKKLYSEFLSLKEDGSIELVEDKNTNSLNLVISENGNSLKVTFSLDIKGKEAEDRLSYVDNLRRKANLFGRASLEIKNYLKRYVYTELHKAGDIDEETLNRRLGKFIEKL